MINNIGNFIEKIGKRNFILVLFIICAVLITSLYSTFSLTTTTEEMSIIDGTKTLKYVLGDEEENSVLIASNSSKNIAITISNKEITNLKYGIYYSSLNDLKDVDIGYHHTTEHLPTGIIKAKEDYIITIRIENNSNDLKTINFGIVYGLENGGDLVLEENQHFLNQKMNFPLSEASKGSYVVYAGSNGCGEEECKGRNANDFENKNVGFCGNQENHYQNSGWRIAYVKKGSAYLISAGSPECLKQEENDNEKMLKQINEIAQNYCNMDYAYEGACNEKTSWAMNKEDFHNITNKLLNDNTCLDKEINNDCGKDLDLIDTGSNYWLSNIISNNILYYQHKTPSYSINKNDESKGIRPVLKLANTIVVTKGSGTKEDPYIIKNTVVSNYEYKVVYNGNGATSGDTEDSMHQTNTPKKLNKNKFTLTYQVKKDEYATFDDSYCEEEVCHESSVKQEETQNAKFLGWSLYSDDRIPMYEDEQEVNNLSISSSEIIVNLYAIWEYTAFKLPNIQEREGYNILGWYTEKEGGEKVGDVGDTYTNTEKITLYARWQKK